MSTKIYVAWRCKLSDLENVLNQARDVMRERAVERCKKILAATTDKAIKYEWKEYRNLSFIKKLHQSKKMTLKKFTEKNGKNAKMRVVLKLLFEMSKSPLRAPGIDVDFSMNVWIRGRFAYIIPYGEVLWGDKIPIPEGAEDYSYWNNTDPPEEVSSRAWNARRKAWDTILDDWNRGRLQYEVISIKDNIGNAYLVSKCLKKAPSMHYHVMEGDEIPEKEKKGLLDFTGISFR